MKERKEPSPGGSQGRGQLPPIGEAVWVRCEGYRTMAYRDAKGVWRSLGNGKELEGVIEVVQPGPRL